MWILAYLASSLTTAAIAAIWINSVSSAWTWCICTLVFFAGNMYGLAEARFRFGMRQTETPPGEGNAGR